MFYMQQVDNIESLTWLEMFQVLSTSAWYTMQNQRHVQVVLL